MGHHREHDVANFVKRMVQVARHSNNSEQYILKCVLTREMHTRQQALNYWHTKDWPWGEVLTHVYTKEFHFMWTITSVK